MDRVRCATCGDEHDLSEMEPSFDRPDAYFDVSRDERAERIWSVDSLCVISGGPAEADRYFLRVLLPIPVRGEPSPFCWGVWVEVDESAFERTHASFNEADDVSAAPFPGRLANAIPDMPQTRGLTGLVHLTGPTTVPEFTLDDEAGHPLVIEQHDGVYPERLLEWLMPAVHDAP